MTYRELQNQLKQFKLDGLTEIKLTEKKEVLQAEYDRIMAKSRQEENQEINQETFLDFATNAFIGIIKETLLDNFACYYVVTDAMVLGNKELTVKEFLTKIAKEAELNSIDFLLAVEQKMQDNYDFDLTDYRYDTVNYLLKNFDFALTGTKEKTPVLEVVEETDPSLNIAIQYFVDAINHVFKRFGSDNLITSGYLTHYLVNDVSINDFIKFLNLNTGFEFTEFMDYLECYLEDQYEYFIKYASLNYRICPLKMIIQDFAEVINIFQLVA